MKKDWKDTIKKVLIITSTIIVLGLLIWFATISLRKSASANFYKDAQKLNEENKPDKAVTKLENAVFLDPSNDEAIYLLGKIHRENLAFDRAFNCFKKAYFLKQNNDLYLLAFAEQAIKISKENYLLEVLEKRPTDDLTKTISVLTYLQTDNDKNAKTQAKNIEDEELKSYISSLVDLSKNPDAKIGSISIFKKFAVPEFVGWHLNINSDYQKLFKKFETDREKTEISETKKLLILNLFCDLGFSNLAVPKAKKLTHDFPDYRDAWLVWGRAQYMEQNYEEAIDTFKSAQKLDPNYLPTLEMLAQTYNVLDLADQEVDIRTKIEKLKY